MKVKITIDETICHKNNLTLEEFLLALLYKQTQNLVEVRRGLVDKDVIALKNGHYKLNPFWILKLDDILCASKNGGRTNEQLEQLAMALMDKEVYPEGKQRDKNGQITSFYYHCNKSDVADHLRRFFVHYGNYTDEQIIEATKKYVASFQGQYWQKGMRLLKYFIIKLNKETGEITSPLADQLENPEEKEEYTDNNGEWIMNVKN